MAASGLLRERDLRALTAVVEDGLRDDPGPAMPWAAFDQLLQLIPSAIVQLDEFDVQRRRALTWQAIEDGGDRFHDFDDHENTDDDLSRWELREKFLPYSYPVRTGDTTSVIRWSDFYTACELKNAPFYPVRGEGQPGQIFDPCSAPSWARPGPTDSLLARQP